jgi:hypothetical protein
MGTLHEDLHTFLHTGMARWAIPDSDVTGPLAKVKGQILADAPELLLYA